MQANDTPAPADVEEDAESVASEEEEKDDESVADEVWMSADMVEEPEEDDESVAEEEDAESVASEVRADSIPEDPCAKCNRNTLDCVCEADFWASDDEDDTPVATLIANKVAENKDELIAKLQAQVAELQLQLQDAKDDIKDMVAGLKGIITNQTSRETLAALPAYEPKPRTTATATKPKAKAPAPVVEQPEGKRYTYKRPMSYEHDYCKDQMVVEMSIKRLWVKGTAMRLAYDPYGEDASAAGEFHGHWVGLNAQWKGRRFLNLQRASTECCELNQIANSPNAWAAFRCINPENDEYISIERLDKHPNWRECRVLMRGDEGASGEDSEDEDE
jgi:hypothetical protein